MWKTRYKTMIEFLDQRVFLWQHLMPQAHELFARHLLLCRQRLQNFRPHRASLGFHNIFLMHLRISAAKQAIVQLAVRILRKEVGRFERSRIRSVPANA
jgi:hypothetical protein